MQYQYTVRFPSLRILVAIIELKGFEAATRFFARSFSSTARVVASTAPGPPAVSCSLDFSSEVEQVLNLPI